MVLCPYGTGKDSLGCRAVKEAYVPNACDWERLCASPEFRNCPLYCRAEYGAR